MSYYKKILIKKFHKICDMKTSCRSFCACKELSTNSIGKWNFWRKLPILNTYLQNCQKFVLISKQTSSNSFLQRIIWSFDIFFFFFFCNVTQILAPDCIYSPIYSVKCVSNFMFRIWWHHDIWISKNLKSDYLKNEKRFWNEMKTLIFFLKKVLSFKHIKQTSKDVADKTFKFV